MDVLDEIRRQVAVAGRVTGIAGLSVSGATVEITSAPPAFLEWMALRALPLGPSWNSLPERPGRTVSRDGGLFYFMDLPDGDYVVTVSMPGAGSRMSSAQAGFTVKRDSSGNVALTVLQIALPATTLAGNVTGGGNPVAMASVEIAGSGERAFTDSKGNYILPGLETGNRQLQVYAQGFQQKTQPVLISSVGITQTLNISLTPA